MSAFPEPRVDDATVELRIPREKRPYVQVFDAVAAGEQMLRGALREANAEQTLAVSCPDRRRPDEPPALRSFDLDQPVEVGRRELCLGVLLHQSTPTTPGAAAFSTRQGVRSSSMSSLQPAQIGIS